jgi:site-specific DNA-methyltransferase (adenine-specific)
MPEIQTEMSCKSGVLEGETVTGMAYNVNKHPNELKPHPINTDIYGTESADLDLVESIRKKGILESVVIKEDNTILSGHRRWVASKELNLKSIPCRVLAFDNNLDEEEALIEFNRQRIKNFTQTMKESEYLLHIEKERAEQRRKATQTTDGKMKSVPVTPTLVEPSKTEIKRSERESSTIVAEKVGMKRENFNKARKVWEAAKIGNEVAIEAVKKLDEKTTTINQAFTKVKYRDDGNSKTSSFGTIDRVGHDATAYYDRNVNADANNENVLNEIGVPQPRLSSEESKGTIASDVCYISSSTNMKEVPTNSIHLVITSPPYNVGKDYDDDLTLKEYLKLLTDVFTETYRVLVVGGRVCVNVANIGRKPYIPLNCYVAYIMRQIGFHQRGEIIWDKGASAGSSAAWGSWQSASNPSLRDVHEYILVFSKGEYGREQGESTITRDEFLEYTKSIWSFTAASAKRIGHPAPFPLELPKRLIKLYSYKGDIVLDPFIGSGQTAIAAVECNRHYIGYDISSEYVDLANKRIKEGKSVAPD